MKFKFLLALVLFLATLNPAISAETAPAKGDDKQQAIAMLKEFYTEYSTVKFTSAYVEKIQALQNKYCTIGFRKELQKEFKAAGLDHDLLTREYGINPEDLKTLVITKDNPANAYLVSYTTHTTNTSNQPIDRKVELHVSVLKEGDSFKIAAVTTDEEQFSIFFEKFKEIVKSDNMEMMPPIVYFPFQTVPQWSNDELKSGNVDKKTGLLNKEQLFNNYDAMFAPEFAKKILKSTEEDLSEIDPDTDEDYYKTLMSVTDKGSSLYELFIQYAQENGNETSFAFVFGKVNGFYKVIAYHSPWPVN